MISHFKYQWSRHSSGIFLCLSSLALSRILLHFVWHSCWLFICSQSPFNNHRRLCSADALGAIEGVSSWCLIPDTEMAQIRFCHTTILFLILKIRVCLPTDILMLHCFFIVKGWDTAIFDAMKQTALHGITARRLHSSSWWMCWMPGDVLKLSKITFLFQAVQRASEYIIWCCAIQCVLDVLACCDLLQSSCIVDGGAGCFVL